MKRFIKLLALVCAVGVAAYMVDNEQRQREHGWGFTGHDWMKQFDQGAS